VRCGGKTFLNAGEGGISHKLGENERGEKTEGRIIPENIFLPRALGSEAESTI